MLATLKRLLPSAPLDLVFPPDPGSLRLLAALRATLAGTLTFLLVLGLGTIIVIPTTDRIVGFAIALFIAATVRDGTPRQRLITIALAPVAAFAATALAAALLHQQIAAILVMPLIMFAVAYAAIRSPRLASLTMVGLIAYMMGLVTRQPLETLPVRTVILLLAAADAALVRLLLLPERPQTELDRLRHAIRAQISRVLGRIGAAVIAGTWTDLSRAQLHRDVYRLGEMIMLAQARVAALAAQLPDQGHRWLYLLTIELCTERVARVALDDLGMPADRPALLSIIGVVQRGADLPPQQSSTQLYSALSLLGHALLETPEGAPPPAAPPPPTTAFGLRPAIQAALAAGLAIIGGELVSPNRWYWAAFAAFVMFQGTRTRDESITKGVQFMIGTLAGAVVGVLLATLLSGHEIATLAAIIVAVFMAFQANIAAYGAMVFWITIILGLMFGMLGYFPSDLLLLRLEETGVGAACGALVASLVLVRDGRAATRDAAIAFLHALGRLVDGAVRALLDGNPEPDLTTRILAAEQCFHDLNGIAHLEQSGMVMSRNEPLRRRMLLLEACDQWARELGQISLRSVALDDPTLVKSVRATITRIDTTLPALISHMTDQIGNPPIADEPANDLGQAAQDDLSHRAVRLLLRIDGALVHLASR